jgi:uncharacterized membrane protein
VKFKWLGIILVVWLYVGFRLLNLTASCLWFDEIFSVHAAQHSWNEILGFVAQDLIHPPLFYILLKFWMMIGGESLLWLRLFPVAAACAALVPLILLCRELKFSTIETISVILLLAVNGSLIKYAQEVRMYSLLFCLSIFSIWLFMRWLKRDTISLLPLFLVNLALIYTHYFGWLILLAELAIVLWLNKDRRKWMMLAPLWALSFLPWTYAVFTAYKQNAGSAGLEQNLNWADKPGLAQLLQFIAVLHQPFYFQQSSVDASFSFPAIPILIVCSILVICLFIFEKDERREITILMLFAVAPLVIAFIVSWITPFSVWGTRHLIVIFVPYLLLAVMGIKYITPRSAQYACYSIFLIAAVPALVLFTVRQQPLYSWCGWNRLAEEVKDSDAGKVYVFEDAVAYEFWFAAQREAEGKLNVVLIEDDPDIPEDKAYFLPRGFDGIQKVNEDSISGDKFWIAARNIWDEQDHPLWQKLKAKGYKLGPALRLRTKDAFDFMVPVEKEK